MAEGMAQRSLKVYVEFKTQSEDVTGAGRVGTMKLGKSGLHLE